MVDRPQDLGGPTLVTAHSKPLNALARIRKICNRDATLLSLKLSQDFRPDWAIINLEAS